MSTRRGWILAVALAGILVIGTGTVSAEDPGERVVKAGETDVDETLVYYGNPNRFRQAGEIVCDSVFRAIPEYRRIIEEGLTEGVRYDFLLLRANQKFRKALRKVHRQDGYDLVAEIGAVRIEGKTVPDITDKVIDALPE